MSKIFSLDSSVVNSQIRNTMFWFYLKIMSNKCPCFGKRNICVSQDFVVSKDSLNLVLQEIK